MEIEERDATLGEAWRLDPSSRPVATLTEIVARIGPHRDDSPPADLPFRLRRKAAAAAAEARARGGGGTVAPGEVLLREEPAALRMLGASLREGCILVAGTNGKTTTAGLIATILRRSGRVVAHNHAGANAPAGIATALLTPDADFGVFEVDEAWLPIVAAELLPDAIVLGNLFRDRLDNYGEVEALARSWAEMIALGLGRRLVLNADDPIVAGLARSAGNGSPLTTYFGVEDGALGLREHEHAVDARGCRRCGAGLVYRARLLSHLGHYRCSRCDEARPRPQVAAEAVRIDGVEGSSFVLVVGEERVDVRVDVPGLYNVYNSLTACAAAHAVGIEPAVFPQALAAYEPAFGRGERIAVGETELRILLCKNPAGANEILRTLRRDSSPRLDLLIALNDGAADGRDVSWVWDVDFELVQARIGRVVCSGTRSAELALRLKYAGWDAARLTVMQDLSEALDRAVERSRGRLFVLPTYSALLELRTELAERGVAEPYWARQSDIALGLGLVDGADQAP